MALVQIPGTELYRDTNTMALVSKDTSGLEEYNMKRRMIESQKREINKVMSEIDNIKNDMLEIKQLMLKLLDKNNG